MNYADPDYSVGGEVITDTAAHTGRFKRVDFIYNRSVRNTFFVFFTRRCSAYCIV